MQETCTWLTMSVIYYNIWFGCWIMDHPYTFHIILWKSAFIKEFRGQQSLLRLPASGRETWDIRAFSILLIIIGILYGEDKIPQHSESHERESHGFRKEYPTYASWYICKGISYTSDHNIFKCRWESHKWSLIFRSRDMSVVNEWKGQLYYCSMRFSSLHKNQDYREQQQTHTEEGQCPEYTIQCVPKADLDEQLRCKKEKKDKAIKIGYLTKYHCGNNEWPGYMYSGSEACGHANEIIGYTWLENRLRQIKHGGNSLTASLLTHAQIKSPACHLLTSTPTTPPPLPTMNQSRWDRQKIDSTADSSFKLWELCAIVDRRNGSFCDVDSCPGWIDQVFIPSTVYRTLCSIH